LKPWAEADDHKALTEAMQTPDAAGPATANRGADASAQRRDQPSESALRLKARRQALLLIGASSLFMLALLIGAWLFVHSLL